MEVTWADFADLPPSLSTDTSSNATGRSKALRMVSSLRPLDVEI